MPHRKNVYVFIFYFANTCYNSFDASLLESLKSEIALMEKIGDSIISELEAAESEVSKAWGKYGHFHIRPCSPFFAINLIFLPAIHRFILHQSG